MRYDCPHCGENLRRRLLRTQNLPGQRRWLPMYATLACPVCRGWLAYNLHVLEKRFQGAVMAGVFGSLIVNLVLPASTPILVGLATLAAAATLAFNVRLNQTVWKEWQRFKPFEASDLPAL